VKPPAISKKSKGKESIPPHLDFDVANDSGYIYKYTFICSTNRCYYSSDLGGFIVADSEVASDKVVNEDVDEPERNLNLSLPEKEMKIDPLKEKYVFFYC